MLDRVLRGLLWTTVMGLISACAVGSLLLGYGGLMRLIGGDSAGGGGMMAGGLAAAGVAWGLCRNANDLMDR